MAIDILCTMVILRYVIIDEGNIFIRLAWASDIMLCGIISLFATPAMDGAKDQVKISSDTASLNSINTCIVMYCVSNDLDNLLGQTSLSVFKPIKDGDSAETIVKFFAG